MSNIQDKNPNLTSAKQTPRQRALQQMLIEVDLVDIWRHMHPGEKDYTFFSNPHKTYSTINFFLVSKTISASVKQSNIGNILLSDHAPVKIEVLTTRLQNNRNVWQCNKSLLFDLIFCNKTKKNLLTFLEINDNGDTDQANLWETTKAYLRGLMISYCSATKSKKTKVHRGLEIALQEEEL